MDSYLFGVGTSTGVMNRTAVLYALISAALFGVSTPAAKLLIGSIHPVTLAGLLYCGAGVGVAVLRRIVPAVVAGASETAVSRADLPWLAAAIGVGGVLGPLLLMLGLARTNAATASLLLTLEGVATALMAWFIFHENFDRRIAIGMASLVAGAAVLSWSGAPTQHRWPTRYRWCLRSVGTGQQSDAQGFAGRSVANRHVERIDRRSIQSHSWFEHQP